MIYWNGLAPYWPSISMVLVGIAVSLYLLQQRKEKYKALIVALFFFLLWLLYPPLLAQFIANEFLQSFLVGIWIIGFIISCSVQIVTSFEQKSVVILLFLAEAASFKIILWSFWVVGENWY